MSAVCGDESLEYVKSIFLTAIRQC